MITMEEQIQELIVPTSELAFAVKKDGTFISNFSEMKDGRPDVKPESITTFFEGLIKFIKTCEEPVLVCFAMAEMMTAPLRQAAVKNRMDKMISEIKSKLDNQI